MLEQLSTVVQPLPAVLAFGAVWLFWKAFTRFFHRSPLDNVPGPKSTSWWKGTLGNIYDRHGWAFLDSLDTYDGVARVDGLFGAKLLYVFDPTALQHIVLKDQHVFDAATWFTESLKMMFGPGLLSTYGDHHRKQRKMLNPVFSINHMRHMTPIFYKITHGLRDAMSVEVKDHPKDLNMLEWMGRTALELIGQGGLGYSFDPLTAVVSNPYGDALKAFIPTISSLGPLRFLTHHLKYFESLPFRRKVVEYSPVQNLRKLGRVVDQMDTMSKEVFDLKKQALAAGDEAVMEQVGEGKDIMSILLKANIMASNEDKLPEDELIAQMTTLLFAATDTTSGALTQILQLLAEHQDVQDKLRQEIMAAAQDDDIPYDELIALPYMDAICRETLRLFPPVTYVFREAHQNAVLPISQPIRGNDGKMMNEIPIPKGTVFIVGIRSSNRNKTLWGDDVLEWKPERWLSPFPETLTNARIPGVYSNLMTFFGGGRSCIGFKFSQLEMKIVLSVLIASFKFSMPDNEKDIIWNMASVKYPTVGKHTMKPSFPMKVERLPKA